MRSETLTNSLARARAGRYIFIACPWNGKGGGMFRVAEYLLQAQKSEIPPESAELRALDTRGAHGAIYSMWVLATALVKIVRGRASGQLVGIHVNMAERLSVFRKGAVIVLSRALGIPVVLHLHAAQLHHFYLRLPRPLQAMTRWVFSLPESCVVLGTTAQRFVVDELRVPASRVEIVINGVPAPTVPRRVGREDAVKRLLFVGNLSERKGVTDLLQALSRPGFENLQLELVLAGGGDIPAYHAKARALGLEKMVSFTGWSEQREVAALMAQADILVLPSYDEGLPLVILEALANGVAVVCTPVGEIPSALTDGVTACFVEPGDVNGLAESLQNLLRQPELIKTLEKNGKALYERDFSLPQFFFNIARIHQRSFGVSAHGAVFFVPVKKKLHD
jgi:glycosyltransferase involved in cell wall biosynthesis